jgi:hypothetical protein
VPCPPATKECTCEKLSRHQPQAWNPTKCWQPQHQHASSWNAARSASPYLQWASHRCRCTSAILRHFQPCSLTWAPSACAGAVPSAHEAACSSAAAAADVVLLLQVSGTAISWGRWAGDQGRDLRTQQAAPTEAGHEQLHEVHCQQQNTDAPARQPNLQRCRAQHPPCSMCCCCIAWLQMNSAIFFLPTPFPCALCPFQCSLQLQCSCLRSPSNTFSLNAALS